MKKILNLIATTKVWKDNDIEISDKEEIVFELKEPTEIFGEKDISYEKIIANDDIKDSSIHCVVEVVDDDGRAIPMVTKRM